MAISKIIYKSSSSATGEVWMDTTQKTVTPGSMLNGTTALKNDGTDITGTIASKSSSDLTASGATVTAPAGYYASAATKSVASGTEGTPTATKGSVSNHSVTVTPSVTNTAGYISGGTKTGTAVSVSVSELESGTKTITGNGTGISVSGYSTVDVNVSGGGSSYTLLYSTDVTASTSSTSSTTLTTLETDVLFEKDKIYMVSVRDKAGKRNGYFYGNDNYFMANTETNSTLFSRICIGIDSNGSIYYVTSGYGIYPYKFYRGNSMGDVVLYSRYNSSCGTVDGTYAVKIYRVDSPDAFA